MKLNVLQIIKDQKQKQNRLHKAQIAHIVGAKKC
jgi:molybdenum cofactor biosynthesis enzyme